MTLESNYAPKSYNGNDSTTVFSFPFKINKASDLVVTHVDANGAETTLVEGTGTTNYSISVASYPGTGSITYPATAGTPLPTGERLILSRMVVLEQQTDLVNQGEWKPEQVESAFDLSRMVDQQQQEEIERSLRLSISSSGVSVQLPTPTADAVLGWNATGDALTNLTPNTESYLPASTYMKTVLEAETASEARDDLGLGDLSVLDAVPDDSITLAKMAGGTDGNLITYDSDGNPAYVATGSSGQFLKSNGAGAAPAMASVTAALSTYSNSTSGLTATTVQGAIDEVVQGGTLSTPVVLEATGSETELDFDIPAWAKRITVTYDDLVRDSTDSLIIRLGDEDGIDTTGYFCDRTRLNVSSAGTSDFTNGFHINTAADNAVNVYNGITTLVMHPGNKWRYQSSLSSGGVHNIASGGRNMPKVVTDLRVTTVGGAALTGSVAVMCE